MKLIRTSYVNRLFPLNIFLGNGEPEEGTDVWLKPTVEVGGSGGSRSWRVISTLLLCSLLLNTIYIWKSVADVGGHRDEQRGLSQHQNYFNNLFGLLEWSWQGLMCHIRYTIYIDPQTRAPPGETWPGPASALARV